MEASRLAQPVMLGWDLVRLFTDLSKHETESFRQRLAATFLPVSVPEEKFRWKLTQRKLSEAQRKQQELRSTLLETLLKQQQESRQQRTREQERGIQTGHQQQQQQQQHSNDE